MTDHVRWGILSTAQIAQDQLLPAFTKAKNAAVTAIASSNKKVNGIAEKFGIQKIYFTYEDLLDDPDIDAVYIPLPNRLHREWVIKASEKGKHILCEKPAALTSKEAEEMIEACKRNGVIFLEAFMYQFHPQHQRVKEIIASGEIGEVKLMRASFSFYLQGLDENIRMNSELGGGSLYDVGCYCLHSVRNILGVEPNKVFASAQIHPEHRVDMSVEGIMELNSGVKAVFDASMQQTLRHQYEIVGTKGRIEVPRAYLPNLYNGEALILVNTEDDNQREEKVTGHQYILQVEQFSTWVMEGCSPGYYAENTVRNMSLIEACLESIKKGTYVNIEEFSCITN
ncbi:Gfo/Idh/MocA family protein [Priestia abyssalis]|uniref:Gfo/Idh/MocA family protein n=1 Tax=Priestia abyssalis TaxID=1221450 RepID=UPI000995B515|nr:Gfo/Idh/MocA family oxidoreductase [Priestia abyssalis]